MKQIRHLSGFIFLACLIIQQASFAQDPLPSWNDTGTKKAIVEFVKAVTTAGGRDFVPVHDRIATFDFDGTLCTEEPLGLETYFMIAGVKKRVLDAPEKKITPEQKIFLSENDSAIDHMPGNEYDNVFAETFGDNSQEEFRSSVLKWAEGWKHPRYKTGVTHVVYQPMIELINYMKSNGFMVFIVTGSNEDLIRPFSEDIFGLPENQVIGSESVLKYKVIDGRSYVVKQQRIDVITVGENKPIMIEKHIGHRPIFAAGNGSSDPQMLTYVHDSKWRNLCILIKHDDPEREYLYTIERLEELARQKGFVIVGMKEDWKRIFPE